MVIFKDFVNQFTDAKKDNFPVNKCIVATGEDGVYECSDYYLCLLIDTRFKGEFEVKILRPYIWRNEDNSKNGFAWIDDDGNFYDNYDNPIHMDYLVVVGFNALSYNDEEKEIISDYWAKIKEKEESYYE